MTDFAWDLFRQTSADIRSGTSWSVRIEHLREEQVDTICYSDRVVKDEMTTRIQSVVGEWRDVNGASDAALTEQIRSDQIDVLFDLAGHTAHNRMLVFARKAGRGSNRLDRI